MPEEFSSVPPSSIFAPKPPQHLEPMTLEKIGWSQELTASIKPAPATKSANFPGQDAPANVAVWQMPEISQFAVRKKQDNIPAVGHGVNTALDYAKKIRAEAEAEAAGVIEAARAQADEIVSRSQSEAEERRQQAYMDGMEASRQEAAVILNTAQSVLAGAHSWKLKTMSESEPAVIEMIKIISKELFGEGFRLNPQEIEGVITRAISQASRLGDLRIYLNPEDAQQIISLWQESEIILNGQKIALVSSQNIEPGGCFVDGQYGMVDSRVSEQLAQIHKTLDTTLADNPTDPPVAEE